MSNQRKDKTQDEQKHQDEKQTRRLGDPELPGLCLSPPQKQMEFTLPKGMGVMLSPKAFSQLFGYAYATDLEVSLLGIVDRDGPAFTVREFFLLEQEGAHSHTEIDAEDTAKLIEKLFAEGRSDDAKMLRCWAHSHPGMDVFWSQTDDTNCRRMVSDWLVSIVVSDRFRIRCRIDVTAPIPFTLDHVPVFCQSPVDAETADRCKTEVAEKIKHVPLFGGRNRKDKKEGKMQIGDKDVELMEYCDMCGGWHADGECPMAMESSAFELAQTDRQAERNGGLWGDDEVWF